MSAIKSTGSPNMICGTQVRTVRILFVCLGNICRSPAAEAVMLRTVAGRHEGGISWTIDSAGIGRYHIGDLPDRRMRAHARQRGLELDHVCRQVTARDFVDFDLIIGMDNANVSDLHRMAPDLHSEAKIHAMAEYFTSSARYDYVPDPYYEGAEGFELVLDLLEDACSNLYNRIMTE